MDLILNSNGPLDINIARYLSLFAQIMDSVAGINLTGTGNKWELQENAKESTLPSSGQKGKL